MLKVFTRIGPALLAPALLVFAAAAACAQGSKDISQTPGAADSGRAEEAAPAAIRGVGTRGDDGGLQPNYSRFAGQLTSSALSNLWEHSTPGHDRIGADATLRRFERSYVTGALSNILFREFGPDIKRLFKH